MSSSANHVLKESQKPNLGQINGTTKNGSIELEKSQSRMLKPHGYVGFDSLPEQLVQRVVRDGFVFNILTVGLTGVGKSTLIDSLFNMKFNDVTTRSHSLSAVDIVFKDYELIEKNIKLKLGLGETRGYGDQINKAESYKPIVNYINAQFEKYLQENELSVHRTQNSQNDTRIHVCLYMIPPIGHGLRSIDLMTMKKLDNKVNLVPIICKADTITKPELDRLKSKISMEISQNGINIYKFPTDDPEVADLNQSNNSVVPFAVVASHDFIRVGNKQVRARQYPWGTVQIENEQHSDFIKLRDAIIRFNMEDLRESTHSVHYENYRTQRLIEMGFGDGSDTPKAGGTLTFQENIEARREKHYAEMKRKEDEMRQTFVLRVKEKEAELKEQEKEIYMKYERMKKKSNDEKRALEMEFQRLDEEVNGFKAQKNHILSVGVQLHSAGSHSTSSLASGFTLGGKNKKK